MLKTYLTPVILLLIANVFMTLAWYGHLKFHEWGWFKKSAMITFILVSWGLAFFEYIFQVPANRWGYKENGGPYDLFQLKVMQEVTTLVVFVGFTLIFFEKENLRWNHVVAGACLILAVYFVFGFKE